MLNFTVNQEICIKCGECATDCPARIISMDKGCPSIAPDNEAACYRCQHCFTVCPTGAISIFGLQPENSMGLPGSIPDTVQMEFLIKGRRATRRYKQENLEPKIIQRLLEVASYAPTGRNTRHVRFTVVDDRKKLATLREEVMNGLGRMVEKDLLPKRLDFFAGFVRAWEENGNDIIFRGAPHFVVASAPRNVPTPVEDALIALCYFEMYAQVFGVGTLWDGLLKWVIDDLMPEFRARLGIPDDHTIGYAMLFGKPAVYYARTAQRGTVQVHIVD